MQLTRWSRLLGATGKLVTGYAAFLLGVGAFLREAGQEPVFGYIAYVATIGLIWSCILVCLFEREVSTTLTASGESHQRYRFQGQLRAGLWTGVLILPAAALCLPLTREAMGPDPHHTLVLVAEFDGPDDKFGVTESILEELRVLERSDRQLRVLSADVRITPENGPAFAEKVARERGASVIVWGWYRATDDRVSLNTHYQIVDDSCAFQFSPPVRRITADIRDLSCFSVQTQVSSEMAVLASISAGLAHFSNNNNRKANEYFRAAFTRSGRHEGLLNRRARARLAHLAGHTSWVNRNLDSAELYLDSAIILNPRYWRSYIGRGGVYADRADYGQALRYLDSAVNISGGNPEAFGGRGEIHRRAGNHAQALRDLDQAIVLNPDLWWLYSERGKLAFARRHFIAAEANFTRALNTIGADATCRSHLYNERGRARLARYEMHPGNDRNLLTAAATDFSAALRVSPAYSVARYNRGLTYSYLGNLRRAYVDYSERIAADPNDYDAKVVRGWLLLAKLSRPEDSIDDFTSAIATDPQRPGAYYYRALALAQLGARDRALLDFQRVRQLGPDHYWSVDAAKWIEQLDRSSGT